MCYNKSYEHEHDTQRGICMMRKWAMALLLGVMALLSAGASAQEATYVFPYEGFRYTQKETETVLTQTNLDEHGDLIAALGTTKDAILAS